jgi:hypothetical protein
MLRHRKMCDCECEMLERIFVNMTMTPNMIIEHHDGCLYKWGTEDGWVLHERPMYREVLVETYNDDNNQTVYVFEVLKTTEPALQRCVNRSTPCCSPLKCDPIMQPAAVACGIPYEMPKRKRGRPKKEKRNTRPATKYNEFIKDVMPTVKEQYPDMTNKERLMECVKLWREHKRNGL